MKLIRTKTEIMMFIIRDIGSKDFLVGKILPENVDNYKDFYTGINKGNGIIYLPI